MGDLTCVTRLRPRIRALLRKEVVIGRRKAELKGAPERWVGKTRIHLPPLVLSSFCPRHFLVECLKHFSYARSGTSRVRAFFEDDVAFSVETAQEHSGSPRPTRTTESIPLVRHVPILLLQCPSNSNCVLLTLPRASQLSGKAQLSVQRRDRRHILCISSDHGSSDQPE